MDDDIVVIDWVVVIGLEVVSVMILWLIVDEANEVLIDWVLVIVDDADEGLKGWVVVIGLEVVSVWILTLIADDCEDGLMLVGFLEELTTLAELELELSVLITVTEAGLELGSDD